MVSANEWGTRRGRLSAEAIIADLVRRGWREVTRDEKKKKMVFKPSIWRGFLRDRSPITVDFERPMVHFTEVKTDIIGVASSDFSFLTCAALTAKKVTENASCHLPGFLRAE